MSPEELESLISLARKWLSDAQKLEDAAYEVPPGDKREKRELQAKAIKSCGEQLLRRLEVGPMASTNGGRLTEEAKHIKKWGWWHD